MMRFLPSRLEQERFTKMNQKSANTCLTDIINISIESIKLQLNEIKRHYNQSEKMHFSLKAHLMRWPANSSL